MSGLSNRIAVVTGGAMGIGKACALRLAEDGADLAILDIEEAALQETAKEVRSATGRKVLPLTVDLLDRGNIADAFRVIRKEMGPIYVLNNVAGQSSRQKAAPFWENDPEQWDFVYNLNLRAVGDCIREVVPEMRERRAGRIISVSSECAWNAGTGLTDYAAAKAGILGLTRSLALELAPYQVTVNAVCPGVIKTRGTDLLPKDVIDELIKKIPLGVLGKPEEVAHAVSYFASDLASFATGASLLITGGRTIA